MRNYTEEEFQYEKSKLLEELVVRRELEVTGNPRAHLLGGQSGAGKTTLHNVLKRRLKDNVVILNGDEYRARHPRYRELAKRYGNDWVQHTAEWAGNMVEALVDSLSDMGYNLIVEGTLRTVEAPTKTATLLRSKGYAVSLALMAVKPEISLLSCQIRYEQMRIAGTIPRAVDPAHHARIVDEIVGNLAVLEASGLFDGIELFDRAEERLYPCEGDARSAEAVLRDALFGPWSQSERCQQAALEQMLSRLKKAKPPRR